MNKKTTVAALTLCLAAALGARDTGVFINEHVQTTYSGNKIYFELEEKAEILQEVEGGYLVKKGPARVTVPKDKVLITEKDITTYTVKNPTTLKDASGNILRNLFVGEVVTVISTDENTVLVQTQDNFRGSVSKSALTLKEETSKENVTVATVKTKAKATSKDGSIDLKAGDKVNLVDYRNKFFAINVNGKLYNLSPAVIDIKTGETINFTEESIQEDEAELEEIAKKGSINQFDGIVTFKDGKASDMANKAVAIALTKLDTPYVYGTAGNGSYDCSGLMYDIYKNTFGINIPRSSRELSGFGTQIAKEDLVAGDLAFFATTSSNQVSHVGMYIGEGKFVHASSGQKKVVISSLNEKYYGTRYVNATRIAKYHRQIKS